MINSIYNIFGYQFQTPEALDYKVKNYLKIIIKKKKQRENIDL